MFDLLPALPDQSTVQIMPRSENQIVLPSIIGDAGEKTARRFLEFFFVTIHNENTRAAYIRAVRKFLVYCESKGIRELCQIEPLIVAAFIQEESKIREAQTVKQELAAIRKLFDWLVIGQIVPFNPALSVRGPAYSTEVGKTPILSQKDARKLLDSIPTTTKTGSPNLIGLRDRALIGLMIYTFARISAVLNMKVEDYYQDGKRFKVKFHDKGNKFHRLHVHHNAEEYLDAYIEVAGIAEDRKSPLFRSTRRGGHLTSNSLLRVDAWKMIKKRAKAAEVNLNIGCHSCRGTGITAYLINGGSLENAQKMATHRDVRTTRLYDRRDDDISLDEIERIQL